MRPQCRPRSRRVWRCDIVEFAHLLRAERKVEDGQFIDAAVPESRRVGFRLLAGGVQLHTDAEGIWRERAQTRAGSGGDFLAIAVEPQRRVARTRRPGRTCPEAGSHLLGGRRALARRLWCPSENVSMCTTTDLSLYPPFAQVIRQSRCYPPGERSEANE